MVKRFIAILIAVAILIFAMISCGRSRKTPLTPELESFEPGASTAQNTRAASDHNAEINPDDVHIIQFEDPDIGDKIAVFETTEGEIRVRLFASRAEKTVKTFIQLVESGYYNGQKFHTVVNGYKIEGGGTGAAAAELPKEPEFSLDLWNFRGAVALSNNGADFLIVQANQCLNPKEELESLKFPQKVIDKYLETGGAPHQDWKNPVFGAVVSGMETVDKIALSPVGEDGKPLDSVVITKVTIETVR